MSYLRILERPWAVTVFRVAVGGFFLATGLAKLFQGPPAFAAQIRAYAALPAGWEWAVAYVLPWVELFSGGLLLVGLFARAAAALVLVQLAMFLGLLAFSIARGTAPEDCGCLPGLSESPWQALARDLVMLAWGAVSWRGLPGRVALDGWAQE